LNRGTLLIVGASGRAAARSARLADYSPFVIDLFADEDTKRLCPTLVCPFAQYPEGFVELAKAAPAGPWAYTGGLENYPEVIEAISATRPLFGNNPAVVRSIRDPFDLERTVRTLGGQFPATLPASRVRGADATKKWLRKTVRSAGGLGVRDCDPLGLEADPLLSSEVLQWMVEGVPMSALYQGTTVIGVTKQLIGTPWLHARTYGYAGNVTVPVPKRDEWCVREYGSRMAQEVGLTGPWGFDYVHNGEKGPFTIEVNPRYTAAMELFESACGRSVFDSTTNWPALTKCYGKAIYFAPGLFTFPPTGPWADAAQCEFADIPAAGSTIDRGQPVLTVFAKGVDGDEVETRLRGRAAMLDRLFFN
jgi:predicted ATP-grasp superfamily ATP-dependent carboligase